MYFAGVGNMSNAAEFNFGMDPEAAHILFNNVLNQVVVLPWETCFNSKLTAVSVGKHMNLIMLLHQNKRNIYNS